MKEPNTTQTFKIKKKAAEEAAKWAGGGLEAARLACKIAAAPLTGEIVQPTIENLKTTVRGAMKLFLDGNISDKKIVKQMQEFGLDMNDLRKSIVEKTMAQATRNMIAEGDIERLNAIGELADGKQEDIPSNAKRMIRERVEIILEDD